MIDNEALMPALQAEKSRRRLIPYAQRMDPSYEPAAVHELIASHLEALEARHITKLIVACPPRVGKSRLCSQLFPSWMLGRRPTESIILASYGSELAEQNSRRVRELVTDEKYPFLDTVIASDSRAVNRWATTRGGLIIAAGVGSSLTGFGGSLLVDDPVRDRADAESPTIRESTWQWYTDVARTRLHKDSIQLVLSTRWHEDDLVGRILSSAGANEWVTLILPAVSEGEGDPLNRPQGIALWPERFPVENMPSVEKGEMSSRSFAALYQQRPSPAEGNIFKLAWFKRYTELPRPTRRVQQSSYRAIYENPHRDPGTIEEEIPLLIATAVDCASRTGISNDFSSIITIASDYRNFYIIDVVNERLEFNDLMRRLIEVYNQHRPRIVYVESASAGIQIEQEIKRTTRLPIIGVPPKGSKIARAEAVTALFESGRCFVPENRSWVEPYINQMCGFPNAKFDDCVDATVLALDSLQEQLERDTFRQRSLKAVANIGNWMMR